MRKNLITKATLTLFFGFFACFYLAHWKLGSDTFVITEHLERELPQTGMTEWQTTLISMQFGRIRNAVFEMGLILGLGFMALGMSLGLALASRLIYNDDKTQSGSDNKS
jgi:hypothetical protein